eukprot:CAMPEP_0177562004 /NCGR_PEP_ID=MMETSP0369-20130122/72257_1 /TAXON_ID=447022 ORGANISM="Scrippsiella hangoei-like, Strain SHHI-4" /NCGR_SAMPLE_ID=MMETSP0369 /ASSEMBLY_ACC=CAM_ASM_000364 /LENGTH=54 /DNA_ID=CAMNT_0019049009 /DNA_START=1 /DNA_END=162 /DNA_ORIENTATION=+
MRIILGNEYEIVVRSLMQPLGPPLFVLTDGLVGRAETTMICQPDLLRAVKKNLA